MSLRLFLFGGFEVERAGARVPPESWKRRRPVDLLKLVALAPGGALHRDAVLEALWPDKDAESAANNLHRALHDLRAVIGPDALAMDKGVVRLAPGAWVDVHEFETQAAQGDPDALAKAVALYRGDVCPDDPYSDALDGRRRALRERFVDVALRLARHAVVVADDSRAIEVLRHLLAVDATAVREGGSP